MTILFLQGSACSVNLTRFAFSVKILAENLKKLSVTWLPGCPLFGCKPMYTRENGVFVFVFVWDGHWSLVNSPEKIVMVSIFLVDLSRPELSSTSIFRSLFRFVIVTVCWFHHLHSSTWGLLRRGLPSSPRRGFSWHPTSATSAITCVFVFIFWRSRCLCLIT